MVISFSRHRSNTAGYGIGTDQHFHLRFVFTFGDRKYLILRNGREAYAAAVFGNGNVLIYVIVINLVLVYLTVYIFAVYKLRRSGYRSNNNVFLYRKEYNLGRTAFTGGRKEADGTGLIFTLCNGIGKFLGA